MSAHLPTTTSFACARKSLTGMAALVLPVSAELAVMQGAPVGKLFEIHFAALQEALREGDLLANEADATETYRVKGVEHFTTPRLAHTYALAERGVSA